MSDLAPLSGHYTRCCGASAVKLQHLVLPEHFGAKADRTSKAAGAFIVATRSFDLRRISRDRWLRLARIIAETYAEELAKSCDGISTALVKEQEFDDEIPF